MERKINKLANCHVEVVVNVDKDLWKKAQEKAFNNLAKNVSIPGFRPGKAPMHLIKGHVDQSRVFNDAVNGVLNPVYEDILKNEDIQPVARPTFDVTKLSEDELELKVVLVTRPEVNIGQYTGYTLGKEDPEVTEEDINKAIDELRSQNSTFIVKDDKAEMGDIVVIDFEGTINGVAFDGGKASNHELELGSKSFIPGFEEQLVGVSLGDEVDVKVKFPENYGSDEISGKDAVFHVVVHEVKRRVLPQLDDEFIKDLNLANVGNIDQLRENRRKQLVNTKMNTVRTNYINKLLEEIKKVSTFDIASEILDEEKVSRQKNLEDRLMKSGLGLDQYLELVKKSKEDLDAELLAEAKKGLESYLVMDKIAEKENISLTEEEVEFELAKLADQYQMTMDQIKSAIGQNMNGFTQNLLMQKIESFLFDNNN
ncbi:MAG: trigger factor [Erysipelotrichaceae bacterium]|nr:trigger factor [Erysipelotrichaceae bacterium]